MSKKISIVMSVIILCLTLSENVFISDAASDNRGWKNAYIDVIKDYEKEHHSDDWSEVTYQLIYVDEDQIPELVAGIDGYYVSMYTYINGNVYRVMDDWPYGAMGNVGYSYIPYKDVISNQNTDMAGAIRYYYYYKIGANYELESYYPQSLSIWMFNDKNHNYQIDEGEMTDDCDAYYYLDDEMISEEVFMTLQIDGDYQEVIGTKSYKDILKQLQSN